MRELYEYDFFYLSDGFTDPKLKEELNKRGKNGWEAVLRFENKILLKRKVNEIIMS